MDKHRKGGRHPRLAHRRLEVVHGDAAQVSRRHRRHVSTATWRRRRGRTCRHCCCSICRPPGAALAGISTIAISGLNGFLSRQELADGEVGGGDADVFEVGAGVAVGEGGRLGKIKLRVQGLVLEYDLDQRHRSKERGEHFAQKSSSEGEGKTWGVAESADCKCVDVDEAAFGV
jgi:hypothetical protein